MSSGDPHPEPTTLRRLLWGNPVLRKELRATSRHRRYYLLRLVFLAALTVFVVIAWQATTARRGINAIAYPQIIQYPALDASFLMAEIGKAVVRQVTWFVFVAAQVVMLVLCSSVVSSEITARTLPALLSTPLSYFQIVWGKLMGRLSHVLTLVFCTVPLLAMVRIFGGVEWSFVINAALLTIAAALFIGAIAIYQSVRYRKPGTAILMTLYTAVLWQVGFFLLAMVLSLAAGFLLANLLREPLLSEMVSRDIHFLTMPNHAMLVCDRYMRNPVGTNWSWLLSPLTLLTMFAFAVLYLRAACKRIRALAHEKQTEGIPRHLRETAETAPAAATTPATPRKRSRWSLRRKPSTTIAPVGRWPVFWRETHGPLIKGTFPLLLLLAMSLIIAVFISLLMMEYPHTDTDLHAALVVTLLLAGLFLSLVLSAGTLAAQRQARTLDVLLTTTLGPRKLLRETVLAVYWRGKAIWMGLLGYLAIFSLLDQLHPMVLLHVTIIAAGSSLLVIGLGLYLSTRICSSMLSILTALAMFALAWGVVPATIDRAAGALMSVTSISYNDYQPVHLQAALADPFGAATTVVRGAPGTQSKSNSHQSALAYWFANADVLHGREATARLALTAAVYAAIAAGLLRSARRRIRHMT